MSGLAEPKDPHNGTSLRKKRAKWEVLKVDLLISARLLDGLDVPKLLGARVHHICRDTGDRDDVEVSGDRTAAAETDVEVAGPVERGVGELFG